MKRAKKDSWKTNKMPVDNIRIVINKSYLIDEYEKIKYGFIPAEMEDKWFLYFENDRLYIHRSWTGDCIYIVSFLKESNLYKIREVMCNRDKNQYDVNNSINDEKKIVIYLIDRILLDKDIEIPLPDNIKFKNANDRLMHNHALVGNARSNEDLQKAAEELKHQKEHVKSFKSEYEEIIEIFSFHKLLKVNADLSCLPKEFKNIDKVERDYTELIDKYLLKNKLDNNQILRYMIVGLLTQLEGMKKFLGLSFDEVLSEYCTIAESKRKFDLFEKYNGTQIKSFEEYEQMVTCKNYKNYTGKHLYNFVIKAESIQK